ncbi:MAG: hypothetical protein JNL88_13240 [Bacteroidia bacterium]|nr:hypothetical protein [Bacteroidia bacterium]
MKKASLFFPVLFFLLLIGLKPAPAQKPAPTTEEEYVMGAVGYKMFMQMGVELKGGYKVRDLGEYEYGERKAAFKGLHRPGEEKPCALIMVYTKLRGAPEYYCIPTLDAPELLWDKYRISLAGETDSKQEQLQFFSFALAKALMLQSTR